MMRIEPSDPRVEVAIAQLMGLVRSRFPSATSSLFRRDDEDALTLRVEVDTDDLDDVVEIVLDKLYEVQVEQGLPLHLVTTWPPERVTAHFVDAQRAAAAQRGDPLRRD